MNNYREKYRDDFTTEDLWHNDSFTDQEAFKKEKILLHLLQGDIKIKFLEVLGPFKKKDEVNICNPFVLYAMRKTGRTTKTGKDRFIHNKNLSTFLSSLISEQMAYTTTKQHDKCWSIYSEIAHNNGLSKEFEFLGNYMRETDNEFDFQKYRDIRSEFKKLAHQWKEVNNEPFRLNHRFLNWFNLFNSEILTTDQVTRFIAKCLIDSLDRNMWEVSEGYAHLSELELILETPFSSFEQVVQLKQSRFFQTRTRSERFMREVIIKSVLTDPIYFNYIAKEDLEDEEFVTAYLIRFHTESDFKSTYQSSKNGNIQPIDHLMYFPESICDNEKIVLLNYELCRSIEHASDRLKSDRDFILDNEISDIYWLSEDMRNDFEFIKAWIERCHPRNTQLTLVGEQLANNLDYIEWLMNARYKMLIQEEIDDCIIDPPAIGMETFDLCRDDNGNFQLDRLESLLEKNRFKKKLQLDLSNGKVETRSGKIKI
ncbi:conserved hypothetical protein [Burkholderia cenocepacia]|uniref:hypothetical protein n=1 Tax=Burkholderia cenocepacia TaxID=95486 RepID=UPI00192BED54|nr:hypothetical protein [Burkholderia cenocepacia]CAD9227925.1 conserved hypothetical protein [Burkholderia cenocepacia]